MTTESSSTPKTPAYEFPPHLLTAATLDVGTARPPEIVAAVRAYEAYKRPTGGRSAMSGVELPALLDCPMLVRAGWLSVAREFDPSAVIRRHMRERAVRILESLQPENRFVAELDEERDVISLRALDAMGTAEVSVECLVAAETLQSGTAADYCLACMGLPMEDEGPAPSEDPTKDYISTTLGRLEELVHALAAKPTSVADLCEGARSLAEAAALIDDAGAKTAMAATVTKLATILGGWAGELGADVKG